MTDKVNNWFQKHKGLFPMLVSNKFDEDYIIAKCPHHPSNIRTMIVKKNGNYHCLRCGQMGNLFDETIENAPEPIDFGRLHVLLRHAQKYLMDLYGASEEAQKYTLLRKMSPETVTDFGIGYADDGDKLVRTLKKSGFSRQEMIDSGLYGEDENLNLYFRFSYRLTFPIKDMYGNIISFGGRALDQREPKYKNGSDTNIFHKKDNLFAFDRAKKSEKDFLIVCEGYMDCISLHQYGIKNAVASLGTALTQEQCRLIGSVGNRVILLYDTDAAGKRAAKRAIDLLSQIGVKPYVADTLPYKDADEMLRAGKLEELKERLRHPVPAQKWLYAEAVSSHDVKTAVDLLVTA